MKMRDDHFLIYCALFWFFIEVISNGSVTSTIEIVMLGCTAFIVKWISGNGKQ